MLYLRSDEADQLKFPRDIEEAKQLGNLLSRYKDRYFPQVRLDKNFH